MSAKRHAIYRTSPPIRGVTEDGITTIHSVWDDLPSAIAALNRIETVQHFDNGSMGRYTGTHYIEPYQGNVRSSNSLYVSSFEPAVIAHR